MVMSTFHEHKSLKIRKDQICLGCLKNIPSDSDVVNNTGKSEYEFYDYYLHTECHEFLKQHSEYLEEGVWDGCVNEIKLEMEKENENEE
ncbi:hypothetical protein BTB_c07020 [Bacillus thuringiensis Bt407]|uniref:Uncharacterized protein n=3 Tax=Bacillus thuringiensis TaxID=1428 RepID=A0AAN4KPJ0_BACTU|nr:hypothetical protein BTB_c07020 [Bacillus thuringiensis Bt407]ERH99692.1 hypothetical protein BTCBT_004201 [Bacillus thuringiensis T01-328]USP52080.1 hypothetical protein J2N67_002206 [Bacillus thuringiensis]